MPCSPVRVNKLLDMGRAMVFSNNPFTIQILDRDGGGLQPMEMKIDPGSKTTGVALVVHGKLKGWFCVGAWEMSHRGQQIVKKLISRAASRFGRRSRKTRYRQPRFLNRTKPKGWLPPSIGSRVGNVVSMATKLIRFVPISNIAVEQARFDTQLMQDASISGTQYQQGALAGYEIREYLLEKWNRTCAYCQATDCPLQIEHIVALSKGGSNRISNLALACGPCNQKKSNQRIEDFLKGKPEILAKILRQTKAPLKDAAAVNASRVAVVEALKALGVPVSTGTGGQTKFNRSQQKYAKSHWIDAVCVGETGINVDVSLIKHVTLIQARGRGSRQMCKPDKYGFPRTAAKTAKRMHGFQTGDRVKLVQPSGKYKGTHYGVVSIRANGQLDIKTSSNVKITAPHDRFTLVSRFDGFTYSQKRAA